MRRVTRFAVLAILLSMTTLIVSAEEDACHADVEIMTTEEGVEFVRTPDACFENLPDWPYEAQYVEIDGLRQAYVDVGSGESGETILLLHGQPAWSYLYRKMIPVLADAGHRVIAMDHVGMGRSDKPVDPDYYTYLGHVERLEAFIQELELEQGNLTIFVQDWGSLIGLNVIGTNPDWFDRVVLGNGRLPTIDNGWLSINEEGLVHSFPATPRVTRELFYTQITSRPEQQEPFYDADGNLIDERNPAGFGMWMDYALNDERFRVSQIIEAETWFDVSDEELAAYDAPFPSRIFMGGPRSFPSLINQLPGVTDSGWEGLGNYEKPFLTIWGGNDPLELGAPEVQQQMIDHVPGSDGWDHVRLPEASHFLQDDQGKEIARRVNEFIAASPIGTDDSTVAIDTLDRGARWLMTGIEELEALEEISDDERERVRDYLAMLIDNPDSRFDEAGHAAFVSTLETQEAIEIVERAFVRVSSPLNYHEGYWVAEADIESVPFPVTTLNDIHVDAYTGSVIVYGQVQVRGRIIAPAQAGPGEVVEHFSGNMLGMHPNGVYLNGSGEELTEADGTGSWWVKHPIMGPEGYYNWTALTSDYSFGGQYTEGALSEDGVTLELRSFFEDEILGFPIDNDAVAEEFYGNTRTPGFDTDTITHEVARYEPANLDPETGPVDYTSTLQSTVIMECRVEPSPLDGLARACPTLEN
jgi:YD repeat-containing protein